jgi:hypothetical protein
MITKYVISLDSLEVQYAHQPKRVDFFTPSAPTFDLFTLVPDTAPATYEQAGFTFKRLNRPGRYRLAYAVEYVGEPFATIHLLPTSHATSLQGKPLILTKFAKSLLYSADLRPRANLFTEAFSLRENNVTYYELALDTNTDANSLFYKWFHSPRLHFMSRDRATEKILEVATLYRTGERESAYYVGNDSRRTGVVVVFYCKTKAETNGVGYESFIKAHHAANGLDVNELVYRAEVRVPRKAMCRVRSWWVSGTSKLSNEQYKNLSQAGRAGYTKQTDTQARPVTLADLTTQVKMLELFKLDFTSMIDFRMSNREDVAKCQKLNLVDFSQVSSYKFITNTKPSANLDMNFEKMEIKNSLKSYKYSKKPEYLQAAVAAAEAYGLTSYFNEQRIKLSLPAAQVVPVQPVSTVAEIDFLEGL